MKQGSERRAGGGSFAAIHHQVDGPTLTENRRQADPIEHRDQRHRRALRRASGELTGPDVTYRTPAVLLRFAVGDLVRVRRNDYRTRRKNPLAGAVDVLNGHRGVTIAIDSDRNVLVEWRPQAADGPGTEQAWITPPEIAARALSHGTAMTVTAAQGLIADITLVYGGLCLDAHTLYPAMSRDREQTHLYLPRNLLEDGVDRARRGGPSATPSAVPTTRNTSTSPARASTPTVATAAACRAERKVFGGTPPSHSAGRPGSR